MANVLFLPPNPSFVVFPTVDTTYTCIATSASGQTDSATVTVKVTQPPGNPNPPPQPVINVAGGLSQSTIYREITLDASASTSPLGNLPLTFSWVQTSGVPSAISGSNGPVANIEMGNESGEYDFQVTVTDSKGNVAKATVAVTLLNTRTP
jgi:hypothetical protein